ncbi:MAG: hypothetical protein GX345_07920 [Clostridiales bacterium]|nr:hypothetical protein [Clostridiales bacterium]
MQVLGVLSKFLSNRFDSGAKKMLKKSAAPPIASGVFDRTAKAKAQYFTAGFGKAEVMPPDIDEKKYYVAGYRPWNPAQGVLDPMMASAVWLDDNSGKGGVVFVSVDNVGLLSRDVRAAKEMLKGFVKESGCRSINILSTHNHAGIDTMGLWGNLPFTGRNEKYMQIMFKGIKKAVEDAYADRREGSLYLGSKDTPDIQRDSRPPEVFSKALTRLRFVPNDGSREIYFLNYASHSESLLGKNSLVSADFPAYMRQEILEKTGAETIYFVSAIGGLIRLKELDEDNIKSTKIAGEVLAETAMSIQDEVKLEPKISFIRQEFYAQAQNFALLLMAKVGIIKADKYAIIEEDYEGYALKTEMTYFEIDSLKMLLLPGEIFPELVYGGYLSAEESALGQGPEYNPKPLAEIAEDENLMIMGLANDEIGYIVTPNDFFIHPDSSYLDGGKDASGRRHYEETNSLGPNTAHKIAEVFTQMVEKAKKAK